MPDLLASTILLPLKPGIPLRTASVAAPAVADFTAVLGELVLPVSGKPQGDKGQGLAADGKILPVEAQIVDADEDEDPAIAWLPAGLVPLQPIDSAPLPAVARIATSPRGGEANAGTPVAGATVATTALPDAAQAVVLAASETAGAPIAIAGAAPAPVAPTAVTFEGEAAPVEMRVTTPEIEMAISAIESPQTEASEVEPHFVMRAPVQAWLARPAPASVAVPQPVASGAASAAPAAQVFAAAISASLDSPAGPAPRAVDAAIVQNQAAAAEQLRTTVQAMSGAEQPPLDLSRDDWAGKMVDRIAALRDAAEAADTRIRLAPENLGNVDVSIRRDGDRLHVHFAAENPATRQLLAEAAPRLSELADARGVKLGQTSVDAGTGGQQGTPNQPQSSQPLRPAPATAQASETDRDDRIA
ncbi:flagellar hook-length control protein FliK [Sphingomonas sp. MS122]|uniref:flagellar hook-length control protein FliK n=1 Tax=Sphingomonas sp. MS122 TaxID=3412683 RepID=UPI003C2C7204